MEQGGTTVTIGAIAKGAGMIEPDMATMLAFVLQMPTLKPRSFRNFSPMPPTNPSTGSRWTVT